MARRLFLGALVLFLSAVPVLAITSIPTQPAGSTVLTMTMMNECAASDAIVSAAMTEATRVWSGADVIVRWVPASELPYRSPRSNWLVVRCTGQTAPAASRVPRVVAIASIRFVGAQPTNTISLNLGAAAVLLDRDVRESRDLNERFQPLREARLGRMLGRAIAHEIGHFLTQSEAHTPNGLMKASHSVKALVGESLVPFRVDGVQLAEVTADAELSRR